MLHRPLKLFIKRLSMHSAYFGKLPKQTSIESLSFLFWKKRFSPLQMSINNNILRTNLFTVQLAITFQEDDKRNLYALKWQLKCLIIFQHSESIMQHQFQLKTEFSIMLLLLQCHSELESFPPCLPLKDPLMEKMLSHVKLEEGCCSNEMVQIGLVEIGCAVGRRLLEATSHHELLPAAQLHRCPVIPIQVLGALPNFTSISNPLSLVYQRALLQPSLVKFPISTAHVCSTILCKSPTLTSIWVSAELEPETISANPCSSFYFIIIDASFISSP